MVGSSATLGLLLAIAAADEGLREDAIRAFKTFSSPAAERFLEARLAVEPSERLRGAMSRNRNLRVFVASGVYDLATPHFAAQHTFDTMGLDPELSKNVTIKRYRGGHMMYVRDEDRAGLKRDVAAFVTEALSTPLPNSVTLPAKP